MRATKKSAHVDREALRNQIKDLKENLRAANARASHWATRVREAEKRAETAEQRLMVAEATGGRVPHGWRGIAAYLEEAKQLRERAEKAEAERDSMVLEVQALEHVKRADNTYLIARAEKAEARIQELEAANAELRKKWETAVAATVQVGRALAEDEA